MLVIWNAISFIWRHFDRPSPGGLGMERVISWDSEFIVTRDEYIMAYLGIRTYTYALHSFAFGWYLIDTLQIRSNNAFP